jgi:N-acyl homoserine lactone hydrolase
VISFDEIRRFSLGSYTMPQDSSLPGATIPVLGYAVPLPGGTLLFDTGIGAGHEEADRRYAPIRRVDLDEALGTVGLRREDVVAVVNCHFHLDHCGGNPLFPGIPIFADRREHEAVATLDYTLPSTVDFPGARLEIHSGEAQIASGVRVIATVGHSPGHQSLVVDTSDGRIVIAGQASNDASEYGRWRAALEIERVGGEQPLEIPDWVGRIQDLDPRRVLFAHDLAVWEPLGA